MSTMVISTQPLSKVDSFSDGHSHYVEVLQSREDLRHLLSLRATHGGHPSLRLMLEREPLYISYLQEGTFDKRLTINDIGH